MNIFHKVYSGQGKNRVWKLKVKKIPDEIMWEITKLNILF